MPRFLRVLLVLALPSAARPASAAQLFPDSAFSNGAAGTTAAPFLKFPTGGREEAMGGAAAAGSEGASAMFYNPAGLARMEPEARPEVALGYSALLETTYAGSAAHAQPMSLLGADSVVGAGLTYFSQSPQTAFNGQGDVTGSVTPYEAALNLSYARRLSAPVLVGGNAKVIRTSVAEASGTGVAVDVGVQAPHATEVGESPIDFGASLSNFGGPIRMGDGSAPLPLSIRLGFLWYTTRVLRAAADVVFPIDQDPYVSFGIETVFKQSKWSGFLRLGYNQSHARGGDDLAGLTAGGGMDFSRFRLDYAWIPFGTLGSTNRVAIAYRF